MTQVPSMNEPILPTQSEKRVAPRSLRSFVLLAVPLVGLAVLGAEAVQSTSTPGFFTSVPDQLSPADEPIVAREPSPAQEGSEELVLDSWEDTRPPAHISYKHRRPRRMR